MPMGQETTCAKCNAILPDYSIFCAKCGHQLITFDSDNKMFYAVRGKERYRLKRITRKGLEDLRAEPTAEIYLAVLEAFRLGSSDIESKDHVLAIRYGD